ncbi:VOC family protein [Pseudemcibacter aquimaris]|uniref:VOC family protein n=1 Tax=Pseudemcibacter aquimaris TaxID=2857064 RepID=UPI0020138DF2|nr:VOC family protein [Pseudemcibacter aquimaris]MCC3859999.1 VOC family protein [Pseudemcibacter aquimaris]WDU57330.1 VOC family protein [Pseudemcibacter aquimaris]
MMIGYTMVGVKDMQTSAAFYDKVLGAMGATRKMEYEKFILWNDAADNPSFSICIPFDGNEATVGNGSMIAFPVSGPDEVHKVYDIAIENGATCDGKPGMRDGGYYIGYFRDLDGNKLAAYHYPHDDHL